MGDSQLIGSELTYFEGSEVRDGKIFAQNMFGHVEASYPTAYNLGCGGKRWHGWIGVDLDGSADIKADLRVLPIASDSADAVAAIHVLEHFYEWEAEALLREWRRILKPGGKMILELPCMDKVVNYIVQSAVQKHDLMPFMTLHALWGDPKHRDPAMCHRWGWFKAPLRRLLENVGMREITDCAPRYHFKFRDQRWECIK